jgi:Tfp pilus assembly protein PilN
MLLRANFIEERIRERQWAALLTRLSAAGLVAVAILGLLVVVGLQARIHRLMAQASHWRDEAQQYEQAVEEYEALRERMEAMQPLLDPLESVHRGCESWWRLLISVTTALPPGLWLEEFSARKDAHTPIPEISIRGFAENHEQVGAFALALVKMPWFRSVHLAQSNVYLKEGTPLASFEIVARSRVALGVRDWRAEEESSQEGGSSR